MSELVQNTTVIEIQNGVLRKINDSDGSIIDIVNSHLNSLQLVNSERLHTRLKNEISRTRSEFKRLSGHKKAKFDKKLKKLTVHENEIKNVQSQSPSVHSFVNTGKIIDNAAKATRHRLIKKLESSAEESLGFVESYGLLPKKIVCETLNGNQCILNVDGCKNDKVSYENMSSVDRKGIQNMLHVCDSEMISDSAYHEIAMHAHFMPRLNNVIACRNEANAQIDVKRTPGLLPGSYLTLTSELEKLVNELKSNGHDVPEVLKIKISGDGAKVSKVSNYIVVSFSVLNVDQSSSHTNQRVLAIVNSDENYTTLDRTLGPLFDEINELNTPQLITVGDSEIKLEMFVGGDMKFIQILLGLNSSIATYACPWCKVSKENRGDISYPCDYYNCPEMQRTVKEMNEFALSSAKNKFGTKHQPLLNIDPHHYVPDELHLLMRVTDVLLRNVMDDAISKDQYAKITGQATDNLSILVNAIESCGVTFKTWTSKTGELEYTSLNGNDKKKVLRNLPDKLFFCLHEDTRENVIQLWRDFAEVYALLTSEQTIQSIELFSKIHKFMEDFLVIGRKKREGYQPQNITPYLHVLLYHVPFFVEHYGSLAKFSGQGVEKTNDVIKQIHQTKSNKHDATKDALITRKRQEINCRREIRHKRKYEKVNAAYWESEKSHQMKMKKRRIESEQQDVDSHYKKSNANEVLNEMSVSEIKLRLKELGIKTKLRNKEKLIDLLRSKMG